MPRCLFIGPFLEWNSGSKGMLILRLGPRRYDRRQNMVTGRVRPQNRRHSSTPREILLETVEIGRGVSI